MNRLSDNISGAAPGNRVLNNIGADCKNCGLCVSDCAFLKKYGSPGELALKYHEEKEFLLDISYECSLCSLCTSICPFDLDPAAMFLQFRRESVEAERTNLRRYRGIMNYEKKGLSDRYSLSVIPENCKTVFFPGCTLPGTRPEQTLKAFEFIRQKEPEAGIVLACCSKPSHDLGRQSSFISQFAGLKKDFMEKGVETVITACPNCHKVFAEYGEDLKPLSLYEYLDENGFSIPDSFFSDSFSIHDPCATRFEEKFHSSVRSLAKKAGIEIIKTKNICKKTYCCGEGGTVACVAPEFSSEWTEKSITRAEGRTVISYCAGCVGFLGRKTKSVHIIDCLFEPEKTANGSLKVSGAPFTYLNRIRLKRRLEDRFVSDAEPPKKGIIGKLLLLSLIVAAIAGIKISGLASFLTPENLRQAASGLGWLAPLIYILIYSIAPVIFLPGLPLTIAGGIIFGPLMGVVYTIIGATTGSGIAFLSARYIAGDYITKKTEGPKWKKLNEKVEENGWKIVVFTRLIPLFPFNLLNYFFGLTRVRFSHYIIASFFGMLPGTIAFIVFSSSLPELIKGRLSTEFIAGIFALAVVILIPVIYKKTGNGSMLDE